MIILKNTTKGQNLFLIKSSSQADEPSSCVLTTLDVGYTSNGEYTVTPPSGYEGLSEVSVTVDVPDNYNEGYADGVIDGAAEQKAKLTSLTATANDTYTREDGYNEVIVNVPSDIHNQDKEVTYTTNGTQTVSADQGYSGLGSVEVTVDVDIVTPYNNGYTAGESAQKAKLSTTTLTSNDTYTREDGWNEVTVNVDTVTPYNNGVADGIAEQKAKLTSTTFTANDTYTRPDGWNEVTVNVDTVTPYNNGYAAGEAAQKAKLTSLNVTTNDTYTRTDGYNEVVVNVQPTLQDKTVNPSTSQQVISADNGYDGLDEVTVTAVTSAIDNNITSSNIKNGVTILGVTGDYDPQPALETKSVTYTVNDTYTITPTQGKDGLSSVEVTVLVPSTQPNVPDWSSIGFTNSDVQPVVDAVDYSASVKNTYIDNNQVVPETSWKTMIYWPSGTYQKFNGNANTTAPQIMKNVTWHWERGTSWTYVSFFGGMSSLESIGSVSFVDTNNASIKPQQLYACFQQCSSLTETPTIDTSEATTVEKMFYGCTNLIKINGTLDLSVATTMYDMFNGCRSIQTFPQITNTSNVTSLAGCFTATNCINYPLFDTSSVTNVSSMFSQAHSTNSSDHPAAHIPAYNFSSVTRVDSMFFNNSFFYNDENTQVTFDGFTNLGKAFTGTSSSYHTLDLSNIGGSKAGQAAVIVLPKQSIMNIINALAEPDDTNCNDATLKLGAKYYNLLDASDIAIATAKRWSVTSA